MNSRTIILTLVVAIVLAAPAVRAAEPLGIAMENYSYPFPVSYLPLTIDGQDLRMAYMDVHAAPEKDKHKTVVLLHGKNFFGAYWKHTIDVLTAAGYRVVVPDQIGFGKSAKPDIHYSFFLLANNTRELLRSLNIDHATIVGHSMGGMVAMRFALMFPEVTDGLVLEDPIGLEDYSEKAPWVSTEKLYQTQLNQKDEAIRAYIKKYFVNWKPEYDEYADVQIRWKASGEFPRWAMSSALTSQMIYEQPVSHEFALIKRPTLLVVGEQDRTAIGKDRVTPDVAATMGNYPELGKRVAEQIPGAKLVLIQDCGHIPHFEAPTTFHAALLDFLGGR